MSTPAERAQQCNQRPIAGGYIDPNFPNPYGPNDACIIIYGYIPSFALCLLGVILFVVAFFAHSALLWKYRTWYFSTIAVGTLMEIVGYICRTLSSKHDPYLVIFFVIQYFFIVVAPVMFSAAIYTVITVMINHVGREYAPFSPKKILWIFITCDVVATIVQVAGAALVGVAYSNNKDPSTPNHILLAGLAFQVFSFAVFIFCLALFVYRCRKVTTPAFKQFSVALFVATLAVYLRTCFRLAETAEGLEKFLSTHEVFFGCLEFLPIVVAVYIFLYWHPGRWLGTKSRRGKSFELENSRM